MTHDIRRDVLTTTFADPDEFDTSADVEVYGDGEPADVLDHEGDCDHRACMSSCGKVLCVDCGRRLG